MVFYRKRRRAVNTAAHHAHAFSPFQPDVRTIDQVAAASVLSTNRQALQISGPVLGEEASATTSSCNWMRRERRSRSTRAEPLTTLRPTLGPDHTNANWPLVALTTKEPTWQHIYSIDSRASRPVRPRPYSFMAILTERLPT